ncbi:MAG: hypothetical protein ACYYKD_00825 [Rhodospirillales bacterium]
MADSTGAIPKYTRDQVRERYEFLNGLCQYYIGAVLNVHQSLQIRFDPLVMNDVAQAVMDDIWRYKAYHLDNSDKKSDAVKRAAYMTKWLIRFRPIYVNRINSSEDGRIPLDKQDTSLLSNEKFAVYVSLTTIGAEMGKIKVTLENDYFADFLYDLHFRNLTDDALIHIYENIRNTARGARQAFIVEHWEQGEEGK